MERCTECGKIETPLLGGICPACAALRQAKISGGEPDSQPRRLPYAAPSVFLLAGLIADAIGAVLFVNVRNSSDFPVSAILGYSGLALIAAGNLAAD